MDFTEIMKMTNETMKTSMEMTQQSMEASQNLFSGLANFLTQFFGVLLIIIVLFIGYKIISGLFKKED